MAKDDGHEPGVEQFICRLVDTRTDAVLAEDYCDNRDVAAVEAIAVRHRALAVEAIGEGATPVLEIRHPDTDALLDEMAVREDGSIRRVDLAELLIAAFDGAPIEL